MRKLWLVAAGLLSAGICLGADAPAEKSGLIFKLTFNDKSLIADVAAGEKTPAKQNNVTFSEGKGGTAAVFKDGVVLTYKSAGNFNPAAGTLMMWIKPGADCDTMFTLGAKWYKDNFMALRINSKVKKIHTAFKHNSELTGGIEFNAPETDVWHHYTLTWGEGSMKLYLDGKLITTAPLVETWPVGEMPEQMWIGSGPDGISPANSALSDIRIYDHALSAEEISSAIEKP